MDGDFDDYAPDIPVVHAAKEYPGYDGVEGGGREGGETLEWMLDSHLIITITATTLLYHEIDISIIIRYIFT